MASIVLLKNPLAPHTREIIERPAGTAVIDWLQAEYPKGFGMPIKFHLNGEERELDDLDHVLGEDDVAVIAMMPGEPVSTGTLVYMGIMLAISLASAAASYFLVRSMTQKESKIKGETSVFDIATDQNAARIGDPIPVVYGTVLTTPEYAAQPYTWYDWDQTYFDQRYNGVQYLDLLLCVGQGNIDVSAVYLGDTSTTTPDAGIIQWRTYKPAEHRKQMGVIGSSFVDAFHENMITSPEVGNQEFVKTGDVAGYFATCKPGNTGRVVEIDIVFPGGSYDIDTGSNAGDIVGRTTYFTLYVQELDDNDNRIGPEYSYPIQAQTGSGFTVNGPWGNTIQTSAQSARNRSAINSPIRRTYRWTGPKAARWAAKLVRDSDAVNSKSGTDRFVWSSLRLRASTPATSVYGDVTLLAVRIKASQGVGPDANVSIRCKATRRVTPPSGGAEVPSTSAADAFADAYTNTVYGAKRPRSELDTTLLTTLRTKWSAYQFNHVFRERTTVWEALRTITIPFGAEPNPIGAVMSVAEDGTKSVRSALFTDANIVADTMTVNYSFDQEGAPIGVEVEYLDPKDFRSVFAQYPTGFPTGTQNYEKFRLDGVTNATHAAQFARLMYNRRMFQRKMIMFDTELEGLLLQPGDRIGVSHNVPKWGDGGQVVSVQGTNRVIVDHDLDWTGGTKYILLRKRDGSLTNQILVTQGAQPNVCILNTSLPIAPDYDNDYDYTIFAFGTSTGIVQDFTVTSVRPNGENTVTVEAMNYNTAVFAGAMSYMLTG